MTIFADLNRAPQDYYLSKTHELREMPLIHAALDMLKALKARVPGPRFYDKWARRKGTMAPVEELPNRF